MSAFLKLDKGPSLSQTQLLASQKQEKRLSKGEEKPSSGTVPEKETNPYQEALQAMQLQDKVNPFLPPSTQFSPIQHQAHPLQAKLSIGQAHDSYEKEADQVADEIANSPQALQSKCSTCYASPKPHKPSLASQISPLGSGFTQRKCSTCAEEESLQGKFVQMQGGEGQASSHLESQINSSKGGGSPMDPQTLSSMNDNFGTDFSEVRIHTGSPSVQMNRELGARAFTVGNDIHFNQGEYNPGSREGKRLLAHELTHTVQQSAPSFALQNKTLIQRVPEDESELPIPIQVHFTGDIDGETFKIIADTQIFKYSPGPGKWNNVRAHYKSGESPVTVQVDASLLGKSRRQNTSDLGFEVDETGRAAGADERMEDFLDLPQYGKERRELTKEIDKRYHELTGTPSWQKIRDKEKEKGLVAAWNQIADEVLAEREYVHNLPDKARLIMKESEDGIRIKPKDYAQIVRIAQMIEQMNDLDFELYFRNIKKGESLDKLEDAVRNFLNERDASPEKIEGLMDKTSQGDWDVDSETAKMSDRTMFYLSLSERLKLIEYIADGYIVGGEDEKTLIRLLVNTPQRDLKALLESLKKDNAKLYERLESVIGGQENKEYYAALRSMFFQTLSPEDALEKMQNAKIFPWADPGLIKAAYNRRFYYEVVEITDKGKIRVVYWINVAFIGMKTQEQILEPDEIIGLHFYMDEDFANAKKGETLYMPAINLLGFKNEQFGRELSTAVDVGLLFAGGAGLLAKGSRVAKALAVLDTAVSVADITINSFRSDIAATEGGKKFLQSWDIANTMIGIYGLGRVAIEMPHILRNLKKSYQKFKASGASNIPDKDLKKIEGEVENIFDEAGKVSKQAELQKAEDALLEGTNKATRDMLQKEKPQLMEMLLDNPRAAKLLKKCKSPCYPENITQAQIEKLDSIILKAETQGIPIDSKSLQDYLHAGRDDLENAISQIENRFHALEKAKSAGATANQELEIGQDIINTEVLRGRPGVAQGSEGLPDLGADWLTGPQNRKISTFPGQIARRMQNIGDFKNFREFRETFWKLVALDPQLSRNFSTQSIGRMRNGQAPFVIGEEAVGGGANAVYQLNHIDPIKSGGSVYDMSNIEIVTPRTHGLVGQ